MPGKCCQSSWLDDLTTYFLQHVSTGRVFDFVADDLALFSLPEAFDAAYGADDYDEVITIIVYVTLECESSAQGGGSWVIIVLRVWFMTLWCSIIP